jgi:hypothetical protein
MAEEKPGEIHYVIIGRRSAHVLKKVQDLLKDHPEFVVIVDRRKGERRRAAGSVGSDKRRGKDRRM